MSTAKISELEFNTKNIPTTWQMHDLFGYESYSDPLIEKDIKRGIKQIKAFAKKYSTNKDWLSKTTDLKLVLDDYFTPSTAAKPLFFLGLQSTKETTNTELQAIDAKFSEMVSQAAETTLFFEIELGKITKAQQKKFLASKQLSGYKFWLKELFKQAKHDLSQPEERIISRYSRPKGSLWIETLQKALNKKTVTYNGKQINHVEASVLLPEIANTKKRRKLNRDLFTTYAEVADLAEGSLNAVLLNRKIANDLRGYKKPYSATVQSYQNTESEVEELCQAVKESNKIVRDYYALKSDVMRLDDFEYADRNVSVGSIKKSFSYQDSIGIVHESLHNFNPDCATVFTDMVNSGQYDAFPIPGKRGGAFMASTTSKLPICVFLNHVDGLNSLQTLAHETGHALHSHYTFRRQPFQYQSYSTATAEVASTFFENVVFYDQLPQLSDKEQFIALVDKMNNAINTIHRQIAFFEIERRLHEQIKIDGHVGADTMKQILLEEFENYLGKNVKIGDEIGNMVFVMAQAHFSNPFYVYAYAYGELIAQALYRTYQNNPDQGRKAVLSFMSAGSSDTPKNIFRKSGVKIGASLWQEGLDVLRSDMRTLKKLHRKLNK